MTVAKIEAPDECISFILGSLVELEQGQWGAQGWCLPVYVPWGASLASMCVGNLKLIPQGEAPN